MIPGLYLALYLMQFFPLFVIICLVPLFYFIWLFSFLLISCLEMSFFGLFFQKPKKLVFLSDIKSTLTAVVFHNMSKRLRLVWSLPLIEKLLIPTYTMPFIYYLIFKSYSLGRLRIGNMSAVYAFPADPDLLEVGNNVVIGARAFLVSHAVKTGSDGKILYLTDPIIIEDNATIGGDAFISMGVKVRKGALVLAKSYVEPYSEIKQNEVWGGNPAKFIRYRGEKKEGSYLNKAV